MRLYFILLTLAISSSLSANPLLAKVDLSGRIVDAHYNEPIEFATISAFDSEELLVTETITDSTGNFSIRLPKGQYKLQFEFIGYSK